MYRKIGTGLTSREVENEVVVLDQETGEVHQLNPVGSCIWRNLDEGIGEDELADRVVEAFDIDVQTARQDVSMFLDELVARGLLERTG